MADIAMLVAEEYERRLKISRKHGEEIELLSCLGLLGHKFMGSSYWIREKFIKRADNWARISLQPKSQMSLAAVNGFFSA